MRTEAEIKDKLIEVMSDGRLKLPIATINENAPLALKQLELETKESVLKWVLGYE